MVLPGIIGEAGRVVGIELLFTIQEIQERTNESLQVTHAELSIPMSAEVFQTVFEELKDTITQLLNVDIPQTTREVLQSHASCLYDLLTRLVS